MSSTSTSTSASTCLPLPTSPPLIISSSTQRTSPIPSSFVKRNGTRLILDGGEFKAVGGNIYWLGLDENVVPSASYPSRSRVLEIMAIASAMGATTIRSTTLGISFGTPLSLQPSLNTTNQAAFEAIDFAIYAAKSYGIRLILPLTDQYDYYHGGIPTFLRFRGLNSGVDGYGAFYDVKGIVFGDFKSYVGKLIAHRSNLTGLSMAEEPTILAFETGNELGGFQMNASPPPVEWTTSIAKYLKAIAPDTLVICGSYGVREIELGIEEVDIYSDHYYPPYANKLSASASLAASHNKAFIIGEFDWTNKYYQPLVYLAVIIPALLAASVWLMPGRWWPWRISCGCLGKRKRKRGKGRSEEEYKKVVGESDEVRLRGEERERLNRMNTSFPPTVINSSNSKHSSNSNRFGFQIRRWQFSLFLLLFSPILAGIIYSYLPTPLNAFLSRIEFLSSNSQVSGSFYWSLFGRDNSCCSYVQHNDGFTLHYPITSSSIDSNMQGRILELVGHAWRMRGLTPTWLKGGNWNGLNVGDLPSVSCPQVGLTIPGNATWSGGNGTFRIGSR